MLACIALAAWLPRLAAGADSERRVELLVADGAVGNRVVAEADRLVVLEDGQRVTGVEVEALADDWRVVVLFDQLLSAPLVIKSAALELAELAPRLVDLGSVEIVTVAEDVALSLPPTADAERLRQALSWISVREGGAAGQLEVRSRFLTGEVMSDLAENEYSGVSATAGRQIAEVNQAVRRAIEEEVARLEEHRRRLLGWLSEESDPRPRLLVLVSGGWDESPVDFYRSVLQRVRMKEVGEEIPESRPRPGLESLGRALSALGWVTVTFTPSRLITPEEAATGEGADEGEEPVETVYQDGREIDRTMLGTIDPRDLFRRLGGGPVEPELTEPERPLTVLASVSGGRRVEDGRQIGRLLDALASTLRLTYPLPASAPLEDWRRVEVRRPGGGEVPTRQWVTVYPPPIVAELRARRLIEEDIEEGELTIAARYAAAGGVVEVETAPPAGRPAPEAPLRVTLAVAREGEPIGFRHQLLGGADLRTVEGVDGAVGFTLAATEVGDPESLAVVLVEDLESGAWGSGFVSLGGSDGMETASGSFVLPAPKAINLLLPEEPMLLGPTPFDTVASSGVSRVDFYLDGDLAVRRDEQPFSARLDLGRLPRPRRVEVVAFDDRGAEVGRDQLTVNEGTGNFRIRIVRPSAAELEALSAPLVGSLEVEVDLRVPGAVELERMEFYWKERLVGTRYAPPFVQRVDVPPANPVGFLRVVGYLEDGSSAEDVAFVNSPAGSENLRVELVELYTVVTDRRGRPVRGLTAEDFRVAEDGVEQEIATFSDAGERPLTVGLAIDSSASMFIKLPEVQLAASSFLTGLTSRRDRAFVVGFGDEPFLQRDTTSDLTAVRTALSALRPEGRTSIWKGIAYSLVQLQGVPGKKALIVFSDGADEDPDFSYRVALDFARRVGVPVYVVVSNDEIYRTQGKGLTIRAFINRLEALASSVGGRVFLTRVGEDLGAIYRDIDEELRSQYLLGYYARGSDSDEWRPVTVEVDRPGARARTITGYYQ